MTKEIKTPPITSTALDRMAAWQPASEREAYKALMAANPYVWYAGSEKPAPDVKMQKCKKGRSGMTDSPNSETTPDDPARLAAEARKIHTDLMRIAKSTRPNGIEIPMIPMRFQLGDRLARLCVALGVKDENDAE